jgi:hypothetical protein
LIYAKKPNTKEINRFPHREERGGGKKKRTAASPPQPILLFSHGEGAFFATSFLLFIFMFRVHSCLVLTLCFFARVFLGNLVRFFPFLPAPRPTLMFSFWRLFI